MINNKEMDKRKLKGEETKLKILKASIELFSNKGFDSASVNEISKKAKLTKSLLYHHFNNKESILIQIMNDYQKKIKKIVDDLVRKENQKIFFKLVERIENCQCEY